MAQLTVYCGPMFAGKTKALVAAYELAAPDQRVAIKPAIDVRYSDNRIVTHCGQSIPAHSLHNLQHLLEIVANKTCVFIDEGQFFMDLADQCRLLLQRGKNVWISGLMATAQQRPWPSMSEVLAIADTVVHITVPRCHLCNRSPASHTVLRGHRCTDPVSIQIGGCDLYLAVCGQCLSDLQSAQ